MPAASSGRRGAPKKKHGANPVGRAGRSSAASSSKSAAASSKSAASSKKERWSAEKRQARGLSAERPRGGTFGRPARAERPARGERPNWEPRRREDADAAIRDADAASRFRTGRPARGRGERVRNSETSRPSGTGSHDAPRREPVQDVVLERLEAGAAEADVAEGTTFADLGLGQNIVRELDALGATTPFPIQAATIPDALAGRDVLGRGRTGSGKTIAFAAPLVERLLQGRAERSPGERRKPGRAPEALVLAPTRELALQIDRTVQPIARSVGLFTTQVYGGVPYARQYGALSRGVDIVIGTPGRVEDLVEQGRLDLSRVSIVVLDEADHMTDLGFLEPVQRILRRTADDGQRMLFSATLDTAVAALVDEFLADPAVHEVAGDEVSPASIEHLVFALDQRDKLEVLAELAAGPAPKLVFVRTRAFAEDVADLLDDNGIDAVALHGDLTQPRRTRNLERFSRGRATVLVATDVAARGLHIDDVALVIQADAPDEYKTYLHRSGRTGRAGKDGTVVTLVARNRRRRVEELLSRAGVSPEWTTVRPGDAAVRGLVDAVNSAR